MAKPKPTDIFPGFEFLEATDPATADSIAIPLSALAGLTAAEANPTTGDGREVILAILSNAYMAYNTLPSPSTKLEMGRSEAVTGDSTRRLDFSVSLFVEVPATAYAMQSEPA